MVEDWNPRFRIIDRHNDANFSAVAVIRAPGLVYVEDEFPRNDLNDRIETIESLMYLTGFIAVRSASIGSLRIVLTAFIFQIMWSKVSAQRDSAY
jgi:hypothetical protein